MLPAEINGIKVQVLDEQLANTNRKAFAEWQRMERKGRMKIYLVGKEEWKYVTLPKDLINDENTLSFLAHHAEKLK